MWKKSDYIGSKAEVIKVLKKGLEKGNSIQDEVSTVAQGFGLPLIVIYEFVIEELPEYKEECETKIAELKSFYGIR